MKANAITRIVLYSVLALLLIGLLVSGIAANSYIFTFGTDSGTTVEGEATFDIAQIKKLEIDWAAGSVQILVADTDHITVSEVRPESCKYQMVYTLGGDTLSISYGRGNIVFGFGNNSIPSKDLVITVPKDWVCKELEIDGASLDIRIADLTLGTLDLDGAACSLHFSGSVEKVSIDGASADITLVCTNRISRIDVDGASCDLELTLPTGCGFLVQMDGLSCNFHSELAYTRENGDYSYGDRCCRIEVDGLSCDVRIQENTVMPIVGE